MPKRTTSTQPMTSLQLTREQMIAWLMLEGWELVRNGDRRDPPLAARYPGKNAAQVCSDNHVILSTADWYMDDDYVDPDAFSDDNLAAIVAYLQGESS